MKKVICNILLLLILIGTSNICYADVVYTTPITEAAIEIIAEHAKLVENFYIIIPLIILYGILVKVVISRNKEKDKKVKLKKSFILLIPIILLSLAIGLVNESIEKIKQYGYVDNKGQTLIEPKFEYAEEFSNGLAKVGVGRKSYYSQFGHGLYSELEEKYEYGYINTSGDYVIEPVYSQLSDFNDNGYAYGIAMTEIKTLYNELTGSNVNLTYNDPKSYFDKLERMDDEVKTKYEEYIVSELSTYSSLKGMGKVGIYYKINKNGSKEKVTETEYYNNRDIKKDEIDENIKLNENVKVNVNKENIYKKSLIPIIITIISIIIIKKVIKKEEKNDNTNIK